jgi:hypothetical protein
MLLQMLDPALAATAGGTAVNGNIESLVRFTFKPEWIRRPQRQRTKTHQYSDKPNFHNRDNL